MNVQPRLVARGDVAELVVELPLLRPGPAPERLVVQGPGLEVLSAGLKGVVGAETRWDVRLRVGSPPGTVPLVLRAVFADGASVPVTSSLTVVPAAEASSFPWAPVVAGVAAALALAAATLLLARRRSW